MEGILNGTVATTVDLLKLCSLDSGRPASLLCCNSLDQATLHSSSPAVPQVFRDHVPLVREWMKQSPVSVGAPNAGLGRNT